MTIDSKSDVHENNEQQQKFDDLLSKVESLTPDDYGLESMDNVMTTDFCNYLERNSGEAAKDLLSAVDRALLNHPHDNSLNQLKLILIPIANPMNLDGISGDKGKDYNGRKGKIENLKDTREKLNSLLDEKMEGLDKNDNLYKTLNNIKTVVNNGASDDVKELQKFLYSNLPSDKQTDFFNNNFRFVDGGRDFNSPDGMFGQSVVNGIKDFLNSEKLNNYINGVKVSKEMRKKADGQIQIESTDISDDLNSEKPEDVDNGGTEVASNKAEQPVTTGEVPPEITTTTETGTLAGSTVYEQNDVPNEENSFSGA